ncbi:MAG: folate-binding protein YgfZ [Cryomorphaceae bacterium]|jgi:folate-binding protein YgfZ
MNINTEISRLDHLRLIKITGADAVDFLQGQLTNDVNALQGAWHYSGYCSPKGRLFALLQIWRTEDALFALLDQTLVDQTVKRLRMYVMRSKVTIEVMTNAQLYGLASAQTQNQALSELDLAASNAANGVVGTEPVFILNVGDRKLLVDTDGAYTPTFDFSSDNSSWLSNDIAEALPRVTHQSLELFIPQMLNLDALNGISFKKGCYTGQEIVARMHYLGKLKQRMFICEFAQSSEEIEIGQKIYASNELVKAVGNVVSFVQGSNLLLAVLRLDAVDTQAQPLYLAAESSIRVAEPQAYALPANKTTDKL